MAYLKNWTDNFLQMFFMGTSWVAVSINNIKTRASREMTSRKKYQIFSFLVGWTLPSTGMGRGEVFAISDCLVDPVMHPTIALDEFEDEWPWPTFDLLF